MGKVRRPISKKQVRAHTGGGEIKLDIPRAFANGDPYAIWQKEGPGRLLGQLAREHAYGEAILTPDELADLVQLFRDEPLPESLRGIVVAQLRGKRVRRQGAPKKQQTALELVELILLPRDYDYALKEAKVERDLLRRRGLKQARYDDRDRLPSLSSIACRLIREWRPTLKGQSDRSIQNLVSRVKKMLADAASDEVSVALPEAPDRPR